MQPFVEFHSFLSLTGFESARLLHRLRLSSHSDGCAVGDLSSTFERAENYVIVRGGRMRDWHIS